MGPVHQRNTAVPRLEFGLQNLSPYRSRYFLVWGEVNETGIVILIQIWANSSSVVVLIVVSADPVGVLGADQEPVAPRFFRRWSARWLCRRFRLGCSLSLNACTVNISKLDKEFFSVLKMKSIRIVDVQALSHKVWFVNGNWVFFTEADIIIEKKIVKIEIFKKKKNSDRFGNCFWYCENGSVLTENSILNRMAVAENVFDIAELSYGSPKFGTGSAWGRTFSLSKSNKVS